MIYLLTGEDIKRDQALAKIIESSGLTPERVDGLELTLNNLTDLLTASTLFADKRLVVIRSLSENSELWVKLPDLLPRLAADITLILVEPKPDKRTATFKNLKAVAEHQDFPGQDNKPDRATWSLVEVALKDKRQTLESLERIKQTEDPYLLFGAIASQVFKLVETWANGRSRLTKTQIKKIVQATADADWDIKNSRGEPWLILEKLLLTI